MPRILRLAIALGFVAATAAVIHTQSPVGAPLAEPGISPDGREVAFVSGGDIWTVPLTGTDAGQARLLVSNPASESRPLYSPKGDALAFVSTRTGGGDIYVLRFGDPAVTRLTFDDGAEALDGWSRDGQWIYFSSTAKDIAGMNDVFRVPVTGGTPMPVTNERYTNEFEGASSPDGKTVAFSARGISSQQWWRNGRSHIDQAEIWLKGDATPYRRVVDRGFKAMWPMWAADGNGLYFMSDRSGSENIWFTSLAGQTKAITKFAKGRVLWPSITTDGKTIAFERDFGLWTVNTSDGDAKPIAVQLRGAAATPAIDRQRFTTQFRELALSPDGKKSAVIIRGEVFAASSRDGGDAERVTTTPEREFGVSWTPDSRKLIYGSDRGGVSNLVIYDFGTRQETVLASSPEEFGVPVVSPDGKQIAYVQNTTDLKVLSLDTKQSRLVAKGDFAAGFESTRPIAWSPDNKWIAYLSRGTRGFFNAMVISAAAGTPAPAPQPVSFLANLNTDSLSWSPDGTFLTFATGQRTEEGRVARVDLVLRTPKFREDRFRSLFDQETPKPSPSNTPSAAATTPGNTSPIAPASKTPVFTDIRQRLSLLPVGVDVQDQAISPDGKLLLITASAAGETNLYTYSIDELARERAVARQLTSTTGNKSNAQFSPDSKDVFFLENGRPQIITIEDRRSRGVDITAEMEVDFTREKSAVFQEAWTYLDRYFFDAKHNGADWAQDKTTFGAQVKNSRTPDEMRRVVQLMIGELNSSHLGFSAPPGGGGGPVTGRLGVRFDPVEYARSGKFKISEIIPLSPAAVVDGIHVGDFVVSINGTRLAANTNIDEVLQYTIGKRTELSVSAAADGSNAKTVAVMPVNLNTEKGLLYRSWVEQNRAMVARLSNNRLGYAHMPDMGEQSLEQFFVDLDADNFGKDGVVIDVRNNNGGFVNVYAIDMLARRSYFEMTPRGSARVPSRSVLGQRSLERPTILLTNQHSLSDAEDFTEGYRALKLGKTVGEPTAGWIIFTWNEAMFDGSVLRLPRYRITASDGSEMELHPRPVDVPVTRALGESAQGKDSQVETAVKELLAQLDRRGTQQQQK